MLKNILKGIYTPNGKIFISIILGIGLASLFRKSCESRNCFVFKAPKLDEVESTVYKHDNKCYQFKTRSAKCSSQLKKVHFE